MKKHAWRAWSKPQKDGAARMEGMEQAPGGEQAPSSCSKKQRRRRRRGTLTHRPGDTNMAWRGSAHAATTASNQRKMPTTRRRSSKLTKTQYHRGQGLATWGQARGRHGRSPEHRMWKGCRWRGRNRVDLADRRNHRRLIYRLDSISTAGTDGARQNWARWQRDGTVARWVIRGEWNEWAWGKKGVAGRGRLSHWSGSTS
jgi:hypothetical protein